MREYLDAMRRYVDFNGRSTRREFWIFTLVLTLIAIVGMVLDSAAGNGTHGRPMVATFLLVVPHYIPALAVSVRRLHDIDKTGWWVLIGLLPPGALVLLIFCAQPGTPGPNRFGPAVGDTPVAAGGGGVSETAGATAQRLEHLEKLATLRAQGAIDEGEFDRMKASILDRKG